MLAAGMLGKKTGKVPLVVTLLLHNVLTPPALFNVFQGFYIHGSGKSKDVQPLLLFASPPALSRPFVA